MGEIDNVEKEKFDHERRIMALIYTWVKELFSGFRLLYVCLFFLVVGITLLSLEIKNIKNIKPFPVNSIFYGLGFGILIGLLILRNFSRHIAGRFYYKTPLSLIEIIYALIIGLLISYMWIFTQVILKSEFYKYIFFPCLIALPISSLISIIWLVNYEKSHGEVFIVRKKNDS
jgi:hypothetical protein